MLVPGLQFDRTVSVQVVPTNGGPPMVVNPPTAPIAGVRPPELHVSFVVRKALSPEPQRAEVRIANLSLLSRSALAAAARSENNVQGIGATSDTRVFAPTQASLIAGYTQVTPGVLLTGALLRAPSRHVGTDWVTTLQIGDGATELANAQCCQSFQPGTPALEVVRYAATCLGMALAGAMPAALSAYVLTRGFVAYGRARDVIDAILAGVAPDLSQLNVLARSVVVLGQLYDSFAGNAPLTRPLIWWSEDRTVRILERGTALPAPPVVVSAVGTPGAASLLERPERVEDGRVRVRMLLHPGVRIARRVQVVSDSLAGVYRVDSLEHSGDNRGGTFTTTALLLPVV